LASDRGAARTTAVCEFPTLDTGIDARARSQGEKHPVPNTTAKGRPHASQRERLDSAAAEAALAASRYAG